MIIRQPPFQIGVASWAWRHTPLFFVLACQILLGITALWLGFDWLAPGTRVHWDGGIYLEIAERGYFAGPCGQIDPSDPNPNAMCGNAGWFPLFPYVVRALAAITGLALPATGVVIAEVCFAGLLLLTWAMLGWSAAPTDTPYSLTNTPYAVANAPYCLAIAAFLPGGIYFHATFPMSMTVLLVLGAIALAYREKWLAAGLVAALAASAYPLAVLVAPALVAFAMIAPGRRAAQRWTTAAYLAAMPCVGLLAAFTVMWVATGRFDAYLATQRKYGHGLHNPLSSFVTVLNKSSVLVSAELLFSVGFVGLAVAVLVRAVRRGEATVLDRVIAAVYGPLVLISPLVVGPNQAQYRSHLLLLPLVIPIRHASRPVLVSMAVPAIALATLLAGRYLSHDLV